MINKVILVGNAGADPEVRYISDTLTTARIRLATTETYLDKNKERVSRTEWHTVTVWNHLAKFAESYIKKGAQLYVEGKLTTRSYEKDGETKYFTEIVANEVRLLGRKADSADSAAPKEQEAPSNIDMTPEPADDLPF